MFRKTLLVAAMFAAAATGYASAADMPVKAAPKPPTPPPFFFVNDNSVSYHYEFTANNPGAGTTPKHVISYTHFDVWQYGTNFFNVDWLKATNGARPPNGAPAAPCDTPGTAFTGCSGYTEIYMFARSTLGWNQLFNTKQFAMGPMTNIEFLFGADVNTDNTTLGSAKRSIEAGLQFDFATVYKGFLNVGVVAYKEWQNDGFAARGLGFGQNINPSGNVSFDTTWGVEALLVQPLGFLPPALPLTYKSLLVMHGPKGSGEPGVPTTGLQRTTEYLTQQTLSLDVGQMMAGKANMVSVWGGYRWWKNKFGIDPQQPGFMYSQTVESTWLAGATWAF